MNTVVIEARNKSDVRFLHSFSKRIGAKVIDNEEFLEDMLLGRIIEERLNEPNESMEDVMDFLRQR